MLRLTLYASFYRGLNRLFKDATVSPNRHYSLDPLLDLGRSSLVSRRGGFSEDRCEGNKEIFLVAHFGLLADLCKPHMSVPTFVTAWHINRTKRRRPTRGKHIIECRLTISQIE